MRLPGKGKKAPELTLYDLRGTAATRLVWAGRPLPDLALHMGWNPSYAARMLDIYAALNPGRSDAMIERLVPATLTGAADSTSESKA